MLDIATGAGHTAIKIAPYVNEVVAVDISPNMLEEAKKLSIKRNVSNIKFVMSDAENLAFPNDAFDIITCRVAPHHFLNLNKFVKEMYRVLKKNGKVVMVDTWVPDDKIADAFINKIQKLRDPTHIRSRCGSEWEKLFISADFNIKSKREKFLEGEKSFTEWVMISQTPKENMKILKKMLKNANGNVKRYLNIKIKDNDIIFQIPRIIIYAIK